jgi:hypothetical protein
MQPAVPVARIALVDEQGDDSARHDGKPDVAEGIILLLGSAVARSPRINRRHQVHYASRKENVDQLHEGVVQAVEVSEKIEVARKKHEQIKLLRLQRYTCVKQQKGEAGVERKSRRRVGPSDTLASVGIHSLHSPAADRFSYSLCIRNTKLAR